MQFDWPSCPDHGRRSCLQKYGELVFPTADLDAQRSITLVQITGLLGKAYLDRTNSKDCLRQVSGIKGLQTCPPNTTRLALVKRRQMFKRNCERVNLDCRVIDPALLRAISEEIQR